MSLKSLIFLIISIAVYHQTCGVRIKFNNLKCNATDPTFVHVDWCILKPVSRNVQYIKLRLGLLQRPVTNLAVRVQIMKRLSGWKPWLYDITLRCNFTRHLNKLTNFVWVHVKNMSNIRHDCPYNQSTIEVLELTNTYVENVLSVLPIPPGYYGVFLTIISKNKTRGYGHLHGTFS